MESGNVAISSSISSDEAEVVKVAHRVSSDDDIGSADDLMSQSKLNTSNNHPGRGSCLSIHRYYKLRVPAVSQIFVFSINAF